MPKCEFNKVNYENNLKNRESLNKNILQFSCFITKSRGFNNILKVKICVFKICTQFTHRE